MSGRTLSAKRPPTNELTHKINLTHQISRQLTQAGITFGVWSGMHAALLAGHRVSDDIDIWVSDADIHRVAELFPQATAYHGFDRSIVSFRQAGVDVEIMARMDIHTSEGIFPMRLTNTAARRITTHALHGRTSRLADPVDTILLKAILQRHPEQGKSDIHDIKAIASTAEVNIPYLKQRIEETASKQRVLPLLQILEIM